MSDQVGLHYLASTTWIEEKKKVSDQGGQKKSDIREEKIVTTFSLAHKVPQSCFLTPFSCYSSWPPQF